MVGGVPLGLATQAHAQGSFPEFAAATGSLSGNFQMPSTARLASGRFVVALYLHGKPRLSSGTYFQIYTPLGQTSGGFTRVKPMLVPDDVFPKVVGAGSGFVVVYNWRQFIDGPQQIMAQRYSGAGVKVGSEFRVNATSPGHILKHEVAQLADGGFVVTWSAGPNKSASGEIYARRYDSKGAPVTGEFIVNTTLLKTQSDPVVAALANGGFVVVWSSAGVGGYEDIYGQRYAAKGAKLGAELKITNSLGKSETAPAVAGLHNGGFVVAWTGDTAGVDARGFNAAGVPAGAAFQVGQRNYGHWEPLSLTVLDDDRFLVAWGDGAFGEKLSARLYGSPADSAASPEFQVNAVTAGFNNHLRPSTVALANSKLFMAWEKTPGGKPSQVRMRRLDFPPVP